MGLVLYPSGLALVVLVPPVLLSVPPIGGKSPRKELGLLSEEPRSCSLGAGMSGVLLGSELRERPA